MNNEEKQTEFEAHLQAIENQVQIANLDGGCDFSNLVIYHCEKIRLTMEELISSPVSIQ